MAGEGEPKASQIAEIVRIPEGVFEELETLVCYTYESLILHYQLHREGCNFLGWYDNADL